MVSNILERDIMDTKKCSTCKEVKILADFNKHAKNLDGLQTTCKTCQKKRAQQQYHEDRAKAANLAKKSLVSWSLAIAELKTKYGCQVCGNKISICLDFHHVDPSKKDKEISALAAKKSLSKITTEINKCVVVCANCHRKIHANLIPCPTTLCNETLEEIYSLYRRYKPLSAKKPPHLKKRHKKCQCGKNMDYKATQCKQCHSSSFQRPSKEILTELAATCSNCEIARRYNVSHTTVRRWLKQL